MKTKMFFLMAIAFASLSFATVPVAPSNFLMGSDSRPKYGGTPYLRLSWTDNSSNETGFKIYRSINFSKPSEPYVTLPANTTAYNDTNIIADGSSTYYSYWVASYNITGESNSVSSNPDFIQSYIDHPVQNLRVTNTTLNSITWEWDPELDLMVLSYYIQGFLNNNPDGSPSSISGHDLPTFTKTGLTPGQSYKIAVVPVYEFPMSMVQGCWSGKVSATTLGTTCGDNSQNSGTEADYDNSLCIHRYAGLEPFGLTNGNASGSCWNNMCCSDDTGEKSQWRVIDTAHTGNDLPSFSALTTDKACCNNIDSCVYNNTCYTKDTGITINNSKEICNGRGAADGVWTDPDTGIMVDSGVACSVLGYQMICAGEAGVGEYDHYGAECLNNGFC